MVTRNYQKHHHWNPIQRLLIVNFYRVLLKEAKKLNPDSVLDVGCGEGFTLDKFQKEEIGKKLEGVDNFDKAIILGKEIFPGLLLKKGDIYDLPYPDNSFDLIICTQILEHLIEPEKALSEVYRVAKKNVILSVPNEPFFRGSNMLRAKNLTRWGSDKEHVNHWSKKGFINFVSKKFKVKKVFTPFPITLIIAQKD